MIRANLDIHDLILEIVQEATMYHRHYVGQVVEVRKVQKGKTSVVIAKITVPELGLDTPDRGLWASPRMGLSQVTPKLGEWVEVYFMAGDGNRAVYLYPATEMNGQGFQSLGELTEQVLYESKMNKDDNIRLDEVTRVLTFLSGDQAVVLGDELKSQLQNFIDLIDMVYTAFNNWVVAPNDGGQALKTLLATFITQWTIIKPDLTNVLSLNMLVK